MAARISARSQPHVRPPAAGRRLIHAAKSDRPSAAASVSMCAESASSASEWATKPPMASMTMNASVMPRAQARARSLPA